MAEKRVIEQTASSEIYNDDWFLKDSVLNGTTKISAENLKELLTGDINDRADKLLRNIIGPTYEWSASKTYKAGAIVYYEDSLYFCIVDTATVGTFVPSEWRYTDLYENLTGKINSVIKMLAPYMQFSDISSIMPYSKGDIVRYQPTGTYKEKFYVAKEDLPEGIESYDPDDWDEYDTIGELIAGVIAEISDNLTAAGISYDNTTSGLEADDVQEAIDEVVTDIESVETALETKAEVDGFYDELFAGNLVTDSYTADNTAYLYRQSPSASSVSQNIVGGTVAWNQLIPEFNSTNYAISDVTASYSDGVCTFTAQAQNGLVALTNKRPSIIAGHKYFCGITIKSASNTTGIKVRWASGNKDALLSPTTNWTTYNYVITTASSADITNFNISDTKESGFVEVSAKGFMFIDLTRMFGSTIADYVYTLESGTAGSGIAWLKANGFLTKDYYPYDSGSLQSVKTSGRKIVGKNIASVNSVTAGSGNIDIYNGVGIQSNITISFKCNNFSFTNAGASLVVIIDGDNQAHPITPSGFGLSANTVYNNRVSGSFTINYKFKRIYIPTTGYTNISGSLDDIQIELGSTATAYEPYKSKTYPLDSELTLRGIVKKDANNNLYYDGDVYSADGSVKRKRTQLVLDGLKSYGSIQADTNTVRAYIQINDMMPNNTTTINIVSAFYTYAPDYLYSSTNDVEGVCENKNATTNGIWFRIAKSKLSSYDTPGLRAYLANNPITVEYELKTPTTESADAYENPQLVGSTEEFIDTRDVPIPVGGERKYYTDLKAKLEELAKIPDVPSTNGTYTLKATRSASGVAYNWISG